MSDKTERTPEAPPDDDPTWDLPAALNLADGRVAFLPDVTVREAVALVDLALETGAPIGGEIDPRDVRSIGPDEREA